VKYAFIQISAASALALPASGGAGITIAATNPRRQRGQRHTVT